MHRDPVFLAWLSMRPKRWVIATQFVRFMKAVDIAALQIFLLDHCRRYTALFAFPCVTDVTQMSFGMVLQKSGT